MGTQGNDFYHGKTLIVLMALASGWIRPCPKCNYQEAYAYYDAGPGLQLVSMAEVGANRRALVWCPACEHTWVLADYGA
jgi:hypothetical protein